jgi:hypothetical protein
MSKVSMQSHNVARNVEDGGLNRHHLSGAISLVLSLAIASVAAIFSITGLADLFSSAFWPVIAMGLVLECGKLRAASWLHGNRHTAGAGRALRAYAFGAVALLMLLNGIGVYGFLSRAYLAQSDDDGGIQAQIASLDARIGSDQGVIGANQADEAQKAGLARAYEAAHMLTRASTEIVAQAADQGRIERSDADMAAAVSAEIPLRTRLAASANHAGPMQFVAAAVGLHDTKMAVHIVIGMIVFAFDPLAMVLLIAATISFNAASDMRLGSGAKRRTGRRAQVSQIVAPPVSSPPVAPRRPVLVVEPAKPAAVVVPFGPIASTKPPAPKAQVVASASQLDLFGAGARQ